MGDHIAKVISAEAVSLEGLMNMSVASLMDIHEVGPGVAESVYAYFQSPEAKALIEELHAHGVTIAKEETEIIDNEAISGKTFVFTGTLSRMGRKECESLVTDRGGRASGSVSKKTNYLVAGENAGSKLTKAADLGVKVVGEAELKQLVNS